MMEQFSLEKYLENPSRKVVTRQGKSVRIICTDRRHTDSWPIVALEDYGDGEFVIYANIDGRTDMCSENIHDLFFADEEELTEFENKLVEIIKGYCSINEDGEYTQSCLKDDSKELLDLARKKLEEDNVIIDKDKYLKICDQYYNNGKNNALKDLPKWKKMPIGIQGNNKLEPTYLIRTDYGFYFTSSCLSGSENNMYIELVELENLPKEE